MYVFVVGGGEESMFLASVQPLWAKIVRRDPALHKGVWVGYSNEENEGGNPTNTLYQGKGLVIDK